MDALKRVGVFELYTVTHLFQHNPQAHYCICNHSWTTISSSLLWNWQSIVASWVSKISSSLCAVFTFVLDVLSWPEQSSSWILVQQFSNFMHIFLTCCTLITPLPYICIIWHSIFMGDTCLAHKNVTDYKLFVRWSFHCNHAYPKNSVWLFTS